MPGMASQASLTRRSFSLSTSPRRCNIGLSTGSFCSSRPEIECRWRNDGPVVYSGSSAKNKSCYNSFMESNFLTRGTNAYTH